MATANLSPASVLQGFAALPGSSKIGLLLASAALIALVSGSWMWSQTPEYRVLYANVSDRDGASIVAALGQLNVPYKFSEGGGAILVPEQMVHEARLKLASQGLPRGGNVGFELMESQKFGTTQFQEQVNYQRGLEGELSRTIQTLSAVASARVHLAIPKPTVFMREAPKPSASVVVNLHPGRSLERAQIAGIMHLVSASVPNLDSGAVSVIDQHGVLLSARGTSAPGGLDAEQIGYVSRMESDYRKRIEDLLEPVVGRSNVRAQVNVEVDFTQSESLAESYRPNQAEPAVRSQQTS
ncbi:MAG: flagellar M-ring protein FliF, partial [Burkholderiales bacterium]|nr:flagellar M-ring protein FliF [Burkholderiales bacterium]